MSRFWSKKALEMEPYVPGEQPGDKKYIKLNTNENPYPPSPLAIEAAREAAGEQLRLYPDPDCRELRKTIASYYNLEESQVFPGNGSDEVLAFAFKAFFNPGSRVVFPAVSYSFYPVYAGLYDLDYCQAAMNEDFSINTEEFFKNNNGVVIANPNAPTGIFIKLECIQKILESNTGNVVIIDEAYVDFGGQSCINIVDRYPNLLVIQTVSKSRSLAGLRVGFAAGNGNLINALDRIKNSINSYTLDRVAAAAAAEAFKDEEYFRMTAGKVIRTRERVIKSLRELGFYATDSLANFVFISHQNADADVLFSELRNRGILVRYFKKPPLDKYLRVTIGSDYDMDRFMAEVRNILKKIIN